jgi:hypothetical protein
MASADARRSLANSSKYSMVCVPINVQIDDIPGNKKLERALHTSLLLCLVFGTCQKISPKGHFFSGLFRKKSDTSSSENHKGFSEEPKTPFSYK